MDEYKGNQSSSSCDLAISLLAAFVIGISVWAIHAIGVFKVFLVAAVIFFFIFLYNQHTAK